ncbi:hypothetical protein JOQ06_012581, partial [Pogonophryne albipinna]
GGEGEIKLGVGPKTSIWGQAWSCDLIDPGGRQQRQSVSGSNSTVTHRLVFDMKK